MLNNDRNKESVILEGVFKGSVSNSPLPFNFVTALHAFFKIPQTMHNLTENLAVNYIKLLLFICERLLQTLPGMSIEYIMNTLCFYSGNNQCVRCVFRMRCARLSVP